MFLDIPFVGLKTFCSEHVGILHSATIKICIFESFSAYGKVGVNKKIFSRHELFLKDQFNPRK